MAKKSGGSVYLVIVAIGAVISSVVEWFNEKVNQDHIIIAAAIIIVFFYIN